MDVVTLGLAKNYTNTKTGDLSTLTTTEKTNIVGSVNELNSIKAEKATSPTAGHIATLDADGNPTDGGTALSDVTTQLQQIHKPYGISSLSSFPVLFSFVDDDGTSLVWDVLKPIIETKGIPYCVAMITNNIDVTGHLSTSQLNYLQNDLGWEISSHTATHRQLALLSDDEIISECATSLEALRSRGINVRTLCYPGGSVNDRVMAIARRYFTCARSSAGGRNSSPIWTYNLSSFFIDEMDLDTAKLRVDQAISNGGWVIFSTHMYMTNLWDAAKLQMLSDLIDYIIGLGKSIVTLSDGYKVYRNLLDIGDADPASTSTPFLRVGCNGKLSTNINFNNMLFSKLTNYTMDEQTIPANSSKEVYISTISCHEDDTVVVAPRWGFAAGCSFSAFVRTTNDIRIRLCNPTSNPVVFGSSTWRIKLFKDTI